MKIDLTITCPHCQLHNVYNVEFGQIKQATGYTNIEPIILHCSPCQNDFVTNINYQFFVKAVTHKVIPGNFTFVDDGEYDINKLGCVIEGELEDKSEEDGLPPPESSSIPSNPATEEDSPF